MRRLIPALIPVILLTCAACQRKPLQPVETVEEDMQQLSTAIGAGDPKTAVQFVSGFYDPEANAWRWTRAKFALVLRAPMGAAQKGATFELRFSVPELLVQKYGAPTLSVTAESSVLESMICEKAGEYVYRRDVPPAAITGDAVSFELSVDKFIPAGAVEPRELGVIVSSAALTAK